VSGPLTFDQVGAINVERCRRWHRDFPNGEDAWTGADWSNAMMGEAGEAANVVKKLRRKETGTPGAVDPECDDLVRMLGDELADTFLYLQLLAAFYGVDLPTAIVRKFNAISEREGLPERLAEMVS
jgi:NTP pyrophosphatase (non-canonical NTP hydrolase)